MAGMQGTNVTASISNFSKTDNGTGLTGKIYVFTPASSSTKLTFLLILTTVGIVAFIGNTLILCFLKKKKKVNNFLKMCCFEKNFNFYIQSLAIPMFFLLRFRFQLFVSIYLLIYFNKAGVADLYVILIWCFLPLP